MKIIGLTGGIGTGKSTVSEYLIEKGLLVIDADKIARILTDKGSPTLLRLKEAFGPVIINEDGSLDRKGLADIAFASEEGKKLLDEVTHGDIRKEILSALKAAEKQGADIVFIDAPLLVEAGLHKLCDFVWLIYAEHDIRISRVLKRDGISHEQVTARIKNQITDDERKVYASEIIDNSYGKEELYKKIEELLKIYA